MKKITAILTLLFITQFSISQCLEEVADFGNNMTIPMYNITGSVELTLNGDDTITLDLGTDFMTAAGPDIIAFLVNSNGLTDAQLANTQISALENLQFGLVGSNTINQNGAKSFTIDIPPSSDIQDFDKVFFYCLQFNQFWDFGSYTPYSPATCDLILSIEEINFAAATVWPNPVQDQIYLAASGLNALSVKIYDLLGNIVTNYGKVTHKEVLDVSALNSGLYLIELTTEEGNSKIERLVVN
ncbi:MAG: T9SS type A sorting domain-containing protein [Flavobacteriaceae bacterium]|nr:T9SS type A sorting domain-containing protein [Flavobacteriaceae bacterium]